MKLSLRVVRRDGGTQARAELNAEAVTAYGDAMQNGAVFPPIVVFYDGTEYWLGDGFHRIEGASAAGFEEIDADVRQGTRRDAILFSVGANAVHGVRRTNADKRRAVDLLFGDEEWTRWSDREIAKRCAVSHTFVANARPRSTATVAIDESGTDTRRFITKHGTESTRHVPQRQQMPSVATPSTRSPMIDDDATIAARAEESLERAVAGVVDACARRRTRVLLQPVIEDSVKKLARLAQESAA